VENKSKLNAPFPWFGGKRRVADLVWDRLGPVDNYVEPFAGSLAVLLGRPDDGWQTGAETVNDADCYLANFWRALAADPEAVARFADQPVNECDLVARHLWLVNTGRACIAQLEADPNFYNAQVAGWWVWGLNAWIGSGWCSGTGPHKLIDGEVIDTRQLPHLGDTGRGVNRKLPHLGNRDQGGQLRPNPDLQDYFLALSERLRRVRVCCGDWSRVITNGALAFGDTVGVFLDPPYSGDVRAKDLYRVEGHDIAEAVRQWAIDNGGNKRLRIALCGYEAEHAGKMPPGWTVHAYRANRAYGSSNGKSDNSANRTQERIWFSPHCVLNQPQLL